MPHFLDREGSLVTDDRVGAAVSIRVLEMVDNQSQELTVRNRIRNIMDGGNAAVAALLGEAWAETVDGMPVANLMLSGMTRLGQKLGRRPDVKVDPPVSNDSDRARERAERRERIVESYDFDSKLELKLPQVGRWLPGYGFATMVIQHGRNTQGEPFPDLQIRDPFETFHGDWGVDQQPDDVAFLRLISRDRLARMFPAFEDRIRSTSPGIVRSRLGSTTTGRLSNEARWASRGRNVVELYEYMNDEGSWWVMPEAALVLNFVRNPLKGRPPFYAGKRYSFSRLTSQYEHIIGLMAAMARMNLLTIVAAEDAVMAETNIVGELMGENYMTGRGAINFFTPGTQVAKMNNQVPFQALQQADRLERQMRLVAGYPVTDDGISPNSFVTGRGLNELNSSVDREVREYFTVMADMLTEMDSRRLEWDERAYGSRLKAMHATHRGAPFSEKYRPATAIKGDWRTRRVFGAMAGFDEPTKIITGLQLLQADIIDTDTMREQIDGLESHTKIRERIRAEKAERVLFDTLLQMATQGNDPRVLSAAIELLPEGDMKKRLTDIFGPPEEQPAPEEVAADQQLSELASGGPPSTQTVLSRLVASNSGVSPVAGIQNVGQL